MSSRRGKGALAGAAERTRRSLARLQEKLPEGRVRQFLAFRRAVLAWEDSLAGGGPNEGNRVRLLRGGAETFDAMERAIDGARHHVHIEMYMIADDEVGRRMRAALERALERGVEVRLVYDAIGSIGLAEDFFDRLEGLGGAVASYHRASLWRRMSTWWRRNHRKLISVDGRLAIIGGVNWTKQFLGDAKTGEPPWYDVAVEVRGPAAGETELFFLRTWTYCGERLPARLDTYFPRLRREGRARVFPRSTHRVLGRNSVLKALLHRIARAERSILLLQSYFIPPRALRLALAAAAMRGVEVLVVMPGKSDVLVAEAACRHGYARMMRDGWRLYEHTGRMLHAKVAVVDGWWSLVGSSNLNHRSFNLNLELSAEVHSHSLASKLEEEIRRIAGDSDRVTQADIRRRGPLERLFYFVCHQFRAWM
ncbi:MAG: phosphatidylserine/phosphatidylglycerophosphate/cardiolipin synthase family protein [Candidatus Sumerlaeia bacterium]|nr:phosphatidylserine/phosphatidylglycerophosphate/cardiolipin synthase family protein [Candidatus Sumerlaeia bacterium]